MIVICGFEHAFPIMRERLFLDFAEHFMRAVEVITCFCENLLVLLIIFVIAMVVDAHSVMA